MDDEGWELVGFTVFTIPTNQQHDDDASTEISFNVSALYHVSNRLEALVEYDARSGLSGPGSGEWFSNVPPGLKIRPVLGSTLQIGLSASVPVKDRGQFDARLKLSAFYHF